MGNLDHRFEELEVKDDTDFIFDLKLPEDFIDVTDELDLKKIQAQDDNDRPTWNVKESAETTKESSNLWDKAKKLGMYFIGLE